MDAFRSPRVNATGATVGRIPYVGGITTNGKDVVRGGCPGKLSHGVACSTEAVGSAPGIESAQSTLRYAHDFLHRHGQTSVRDRQQSRALIEGDHTGNVVVAAVVGGEDVSERRAFRC